MAELSALFPPTDDAAYTGGRASIAILGVACAGTLIPALIHTFLPDGGANVIAGLQLDLDSEAGKRVVRLFAWAGVTQLVWGLALLTVLMRYRAFIPLALGLATLERILHTWHLWGPKSGDHHPPEAYATLVVIPILALGFALSLRRR